MEYPGRDRDVHMEPGNLQQGGHDRSSGAVMSRMPSPMRLMDRTSSESTVPGTAIIQGLKNDNLTGLKKRTGAELFRNR